MPGQKAVPVKLSSKCLCLCSQNIALCDSLNVIGPHKLIGRFSFVEVGVALLYVTVGVAFEIYFAPAMLNVSNPSCCRWIKI